MGISTDSFRQSVEVLWLVSLRGANGRTLGVAIEDNRKRVECARFATYREKQARTSTQIALGLLP
jgi:hypothetical protein